MYVIMKQGEGMGDVGTLGRDGGGDGGRWHFVT